MLNLFAVLSEIETTTGPVWAMAPIDGKWPPLFRAVDHAGEWCRLQGIERYQVQLLTFQEWPADGIWQHDGVEAVVWLDRLGVYRDDPDGALEQLRQVAGPEWEVDTETLDKVLNPYDFGYWWRAKVKPVENPL